MNTSITTITTMMRMRMSTSIITITTMMRMRMNMSIIITIIMRKMRGKDITIITMMRMVSAAADIITITTTDMMRTKSSPAGVRRRRSGMTGRICRRSWSSWQRRRRIPTGSFFVPRVSYRTKTGNGWSSIWYRVSLRSVTAGPSIPGNCA